MNFPSTVKDGLKPLKHDHRDYDFFKTKKFAGIPPTLPENYSVDAGFWFPDQRKENILGTIHVPALPYGCTDYSQNDLCMDEDTQPYNPMDIENVTHANDRGGADIRESLDATVKIRNGNHPAYFRIRASGAIDSFDAARLAMLSTSSEKRGVTVGTPWYPESTTVGKDGIMYVSDFSLYRATWHNWDVKGWKTINGEPYLICKPWLGPDYGDHGVSYVSRAVFNSLLAIRGTGMFTLDKLLPGEIPVAVDSTIVQMITSFIRNLFRV